MLRCIICKQYCLQWNFNVHIFRNVQEYPAIPQRCMQCGNGMFIGFDRRVQVRLDQISMFTNSSGQIREDDTLCCQISRQFGIHGTRVTLDYQTAFCLILNQFFDRCRYFFQRRNRCARFICAILADTPAFDFCFSSLGSASSLASFKASSRCSVNQPGSLLLSDKARSA